MGATAPKVTAAGVARLCAGTRRRRRGAQAPGGGCSNQKALCGGLASPALPRPVAAVVEDALPEERRELAHRVFGQRQPHLVDVQRGRGRLEHHAEEVPEVPLGRDERQRHGQGTGREEAEAGAPRNNAPAGMEGLPLSETGQGPSSEAFPTSDPPGEQPRCPACG